MNILVVGAIGDIGSAVTKAAVEKGHSVKAFDVSKANIDKLGEAKNKVEFFEGDILDKATIEPAMEGVEAVITTIRLNQDQMQKGRGYNGTRRSFRLKRQSEIQALIIPFFTRRACLKISTFSLFPMY